MIRINLLGRTRPKAVRQACRSKRRCKWCFSSCHSPSAADFSPSILADGQRGQAGVGAHPEQRGEKAASSSSNSSG